MPIVFVGASYTSIPEHVGCLPAPHAPKNYTDPVKIRDYIAKAASELATVAASEPFTGQVTFGFIVHGQGGAKPVVMSGPKGLEYLAGLWNDALVLVGSEIRNALHVALVEAFAAGVKVPTPMMCRIVSATALSALSHDPLDRPVLFDPFRALRGVDGLQVMCNHLQWKDHTAAGLASLTETVCSKFCIPLADL